MKYKALVAVAFSIIAAVSHAAFAKPISYVGGTMAMQENDETGHTLFLDYTLTPNYAIGWYSKWERRQGDGRDFSAHGPQLNSLLKRWNLKNGQGNIFNLTGVGVAEQGDMVRGAVWTSLLADYETRRIFTSYELRLMAADSIDSSVWHRARVGFAPYLANYEDVNTWLMLQVDDHPGKTDTLVVTPLVRMFYKTVLVEAGYSSNDYFMFNWSLQF
jgi:hypothetical protein